MIICLSVSWSTSPVRQKVLSSGKHSASQSGSQTASQSVSQLVDQSFRQERIQSVSQSVETTRKSWLVGITGSSRFDKLGWDYSVTLGKGNQFQFESSRCSKNRRKGKVWNSHHLTKKPEADWGAHFTPSLHQCSVLRAFKATYSCKERNEVEKGFHFFVEVTPGNRIRDLSQRRPGTNQQYESLLTRSSHHGSPWVEDRQTITPLTLSL